MKKIITALIMAAILFCLPVSAEEEPVYLPNYGAAYWRYANPDTIKGAIYYNWTTGVSIYLGQQNTRVRSHPGFYYELDHEKNATYHIKLWYDISDITNISIDNFFLNDIYNFTWWIGDQLGIAENNTNSFGKPYANMIASTMDITGNTVTYDIYYNTSDGYLDNIPFGLAYFGIAYMSAVHESTNIQITASHVQVEAWYDKDAEIYEDILNQIAANQDVIIDQNEYITWHLEALYNYGHYYVNDIPNNDSQLDSVIGSIDSAEHAILNSTDPTGTAMSDFSSKAKLTMSEINTSYNASFAYINGLVDRVFDLGMGTVVFLSLTMGLVAYIFGRIR